MVFINFCLLIVNTRVALIFSLSLWYTSTSPESHTENKKSGIIHSRVHMHFLKVVLYPICVAESIFI